MTTRTRRRRSSALPAESVELFPLPPRQSRRIARRQHPARHRAYRFLEGFSLAAIVLCIAGTAAGIAVLKAAPQLQPTSAVPGPCPEVR